MTQIILICDSGPKASSEVAGKEKLVEITADELLMEKENTPKIKIRESYSPIPLGHLVDRICT